MLRSVFPAAVFLTVVLLDLISDLVAADHRRPSLRWWRAWRFDRLYQLNLAARRPDLPLTVGRHERR
jgi:hypothetical protein